MASEGQIVFVLSFYYVDVSMIKFLKIDTIRIAYFDLRDYIKDLGYTTECSFYFSSTHVKPQINENLNREISENEFERDNNEKNIDNDGRGEYRNFNTFERVTPVEQIRSSEKGPNIEYDETNVDNKNSLLGKLGDGKLYYSNNEVSDFELEEKIYCEDGEEVDWEIGLMFASVQEFS
ncbi:hypothetical protein H5410_042400 [Solanum commersonii]|uniref:Uncharacterized protein n=1 Tax=Solanum commersonii TaxID=4109 RepID=A0A9J5XYE8_SOLCO|nr:hypothetical protein H5410_042400 [Solanum commersonii]